MIESTPKPILWPGLTQRESSKFFIHVDQFVRLTARRRPLVGQPTASDCMPCPRVRRMLAQDLPRIDDP